MKRLRLVWVALLLWGCASAIEDTAYPIDASYNLQSAFVKLSRSHPETRWPDPVSDLRIWRDQVYKTIGSRWLKADVFASRQQKGVRPAFILVHGGGWASGDRKMWSALAQHLAAHGVVAITVSYRLSPEAKYPAAIHDVRDSVRWARQQAPRYGIDPGAIFIAGGSAGGQIASLVGLTFGHPLLDLHGADTLELARVQGIVVIDGLSSFVVPEALKHENDPRKNPSAAGRWFGGRYEEVPDLWEQASPLQYVNKFSPPMLFFSGKEARFTAGLDDMATRLKSLQIPFKIEKYPSAPHSFWLFEPWLTPTSETMLQFVESVLVK